MDKQADAALARLRHKSIIEQHPLGPTVAGHLAVEHLQRQYQTGHHPMKLAIAIQFWEGDKAEALRLARLLADIELRRRSDVTLLLAGRFDIDKDDREIAETQLYCGSKFPTGFVKSKREAKGHPDGCFGLWAGTAEACCECYENGAPFDNVFFVEAEGAPTRFDWIDYLKKTHQSTLDAGKFVTGPKMAANGFYPAHINGTCVMHMPFWANTPSLHVCPSGVAWDCFHAQTTMAAAGPWPGIINLYGAHSLSLSVFKTLARDYAWVASVKDGSAYECALTLTEERFRELHRSAWPKELEQKP